MGVELTDNKKNLAPNIIMAEENWAAEEAVAPAEQNWEEEEPIDEAPEPKLFGKWDLTEVTCKDMSLSDYINFNKAYAKYVPHSSSRYNKTRFKKAQCPIVERLVAAFMQKAATTVRR